MSKIIQDIGFLRQKSTPATLEEVKPIIKELEETLKKMDNAIGIAAVQIGHLKKVGVVRLKDNSIFTLINPELIEGDDEFIFYKESCLSFPNIFRNTKRYAQVLIKNHRIEDDKLVEEKLSFGDEDGLATISIQHEFDHFLGIVLPDKEDIKGEPIKREEPKIGRNDPCPCGSCKKYKKCHGK